MSEAQLPEELLHYILDLILSPNEEDFCYWPLLGPRWRDGRSRTHYPKHHFTATPLLVSKRWRRVGTPLLYKSLLLWMKPDTQAVAQLIKGDPNVGKAIQRLRLEGGMGKDLYTIIKHAPNIHTLWITPHVRSAESISGLRKSLALLHPQKLYFCKMSLKLNKVADEVEKMLISHIEESWNSLVSTAPTLTFNAIPL